MIKDIFIDTQTATKMNKPDEHIKKLIDWLYIEGVLAVSQKLRKEYVASCGDKEDENNIVYIIAQLLKENRVTTFSREELETVTITEQQYSRMRCNSADRNLIKIILLSSRKLGIIDDLNFRNDVNNFNKYEGIQPKAFKTPQDVDYVNYSPLQ